MESLFVCERRAIGVAIGVTYRTQAHHMLQRMLVIGRKSTLSSAPR